MEEHTKESQGNSVKVVRTNMEPEIIEVANDSEYESVDEGGSDKENSRRKSVNSENGSHDLSSDGEGISLRREEGDGQESIPSKKVDDDEDKKNPQYIPKRGTFYEHDDRTADDVAEEANDPEKADKENKKKVWQDKKERWTHDKYNDDEQTPKSKAELISIYGYDIRNEDGPPRARRRRRYGRGPNKYTRNWEDEDAYNKPPIARPKKPVRKPKDSNEEFPPLGGHDEHQPAHNEEYDQDTEYHNEEIKIPQDDRINNLNNTNMNVPKEPPQPKHEPERSLPNNVNQNERRISYNASQRFGTGRIPKVQKEIKASDYKGFAKTRQYKSSKTEQKILPRKNKIEPNESEIIHTQNFTNRNNIQQVNVQEIEVDMGNMSMQDNSHKSSGKYNSQRQGSVPPRLQAEQKASKRYSSLRQRSLPETNNPPFAHQPYYGNEYAQQGPQQQQNPVLAAAPQIPQIAPPPIAPMPQQVAPVTAAQILQAPPPYAPAFPQGPHFLQPGVPPPPFLPQQSPQIINYVQGQPPQFTAPAYQGFQQPFNPVNQPAELYQPQGGITYYSAQEQVPQRVAPQKRPKAAIPIVPPPPEPRGRGRNSNQPEPSPGSDIAQENQMMENELIYEDTGISVQQ